MEHTFPLLRLPKNVIIEVIKNFPLSQMFEFSLVSTKSKNLVKSLGLEASRVNIGISGLLHVSVFIGKNNLSLLFYDESKYQNQLSPIDITLPVSAYFEYRGPIIHSFPPFNFNNWMNHVRNIFCCTRIPNIRFYQGCEKYEIELLKETIGNVNILFLTRQLTDVISSKLLKHFNSPRELFLVKNPFEEACQIQQVLIQNFETLHFDDVYSLDDMLLVNSEKVRIRHPIIQKQFNRFLKHWIRGSNPRLQKMVLSIDIIDFIRGEMYLNGIQRMEMSEDAKREIHKKHILPIHADMNKIKRKDETTAVIATEIGESGKIYFVVLD